MGKKGRKEKCQVSLISGVLRLIKNKVPCMLIWSLKGKVTKVGTGNLCKWFDDLPDVSKQEITASMVKDVVNMNDEAEELFMNVDNVPDATRASCLFKSLATPVSSLPRLPFRLSIMNKKQKSKFVCDRISEEARVAGVTLIYGSDDWKPSFWPESVWAWNNLKQTLSKITEKDFTGEGSYSDFLESLVKTILETENQDPETYIEDIENKSQTLKRKERSRGINKEPKVIRSNDQEHIEEIRADERKESTCSTAPPDPIHSLGASTFKQPFKPRRNIGISPFKTSQSQAKFMKIGMQNMDDQPVDDLENYNINEEASRTDWSHEEVPYMEGLKCVEIPEQVKDELKNHCAADVHNVVWNSGGGSCLFKAVAQFINSSHLRGKSYLELRKYTHQKMIDWWPYLWKFFSWPTEVRIGTGERSFSRSFYNPEEYKEFLLSEDSYEAYNESYVELWSLSYILNCNISVLTYNLPETDGNPKSRLRWSYFDGCNIVNEVDDNADFLCSNQELVLLNEHTQHWSLVSGCLSSCQIDSLSVIDSGDVEWKKFQELLADDKRMLQFRSLLAKYGQCSGMTMREMVCYSGLKESDLTLLSSSLASLNSPSLERLGVECFLHSAVEQIACSLRASGDSADFTSSISTDDFNRAPENLIGVANDALKEAHIGNSSGSKASSGVDMGFSGVDVGSYETNLESSGKDVESSGKDVESPGKDVESLGIDTGILTLADECVTDKDFEDVQHRAKNPSHSSEESITQDDQFEDERLGGYPLTPSKEQKVIINKIEKLPIQRKIQPIKPKIASASLKHNPEFKRKSINKKPESVPGREKLKRKSMSFTSEPIFKLPKFDDRIIDNGQVLVVKDMIKDTSTTTIKATKTDVYFVFKAKLKTLEEILKRPSESEMAEEAAIDALDEGIKESSMNHQLEMKSLDDYMKRQEVKRKLWRQRFKLNRVRRIKLENDLTELEILELLKKHQDLLRGIRDEEIYSVRHEAYKKGGQNRFMLNEKVFDGVFKDSQVNLVLDEIHKIMGQEGTKEKMLNTDYNFMVLLPEFLIKVN